MPYGAYYSAGSYAAAAITVAVSVYFVQGILGLSRLALSFFFKDDLGIEPAQVIQWQNNKMHH